MAPQAAVTPAAIDLNGGTAGAAPLYLLPDGRLGSDPQKPPALGLAALPLLVTAARWVSARRSSSFERLFPPSPFHPERPPRPERLSPAQAERLLAQLDEALTAAAVGSPAAVADAVAAAQLRSAALTVLSHLVATAFRAADFRTVANAAAQRIFRLIDGEHDHPTARPALRSHAIQLLLLRAAALSSGDHQRAQALSQTLLRPAPPYAELPAVWRFAVNSARDFHPGIVAILSQRYRCQEIAAPVGSNAVSSSGQPYRVLKAPLSGPNGQPILLYCRIASPTDENAEMASRDFIGLLINRHAQLGAFDMQASAIQVRQDGYKLMMNSQCAGLTTRFVVAKMFPDADIYSSWDSTYFRTDAATGQLNASEGVDCFFALLSGLQRGESHAQLAERMRTVQWFHEPVVHSPGFCQFVGPSHPLCIARFSDLHQDGRADCYDGFLDFTLREIQADLDHSALPKDPGVAASQIAGEGAKGLDWAAGSLNRVTQYSDLWAGLPGDSERLYSFEAAGFYSHREPPRDIPVGDAAPADELSRLPALCRYQLTAAAPPGSGGSDGNRLRVEVMFHSYLAHAAAELKRLLCAAEALRRALDLGILPPTGPLASLAGQRAALLLTLAGLLEFPADQNRIDGLWSTALRLLNLPPISRSLVRRCISEADHAAGHYYGSLRGLGQLLGDGTASQPGELQKGDPAAYARLKSPDPHIGRALPLPLPPS